MEDLVNRDIGQVNATLFLLYKESDLDKEASGKLEGYEVHTEASYETIDELLELREDASGVYVRIRIRWAGQPD